MGGDLIAGCSQVPAILIYSIHLKERVVKVEFSMMLFWIQKDFGIISDFVAEISPAASKPPVSILFPSNTSVTLVLRQRSDGIRPVSWLWLITKT